MNTQNREEKCHSSTTHKKPAMSPKAVKAGFIIKNLDPAIREVVFESVCQC